VPARGGLPSGGWSGYFPRKHVASPTFRFATPCGCSSYETLVIYYQQKCHGSYFRFHCLSSWAVRSAWPPHGQIEGGVATSGSRLCNHRRLLSISIPLRQCHRTRNASVCFPLFFPVGWRLRSRFLHVLLRNTQPSLHGNTHGKSGCDGGWRSPNRPGPLPHPGALPRNDPPHRGHWRR
jgi:hypothetical protein